MKIRVVSDIEGFEKLRKNWDEVYSADPYATVFLSWTWLRGWIAGTTYSWIVLAGQPYSCLSYVAFMIIGAESCVDRSGKSQIRLHMGGNPFSYRTGLVCLPEYDEKASSAFAAFIGKELRWNAFSLKQVSDPRIELFLDCFSGRRFMVKQTETPWMYISLPESFDQYCSQVFSSHTRKHLRYGMRKIESLCDFHVTHDTAGSLHSSIETLLGLWTAQWGAQPEDTLNGFRCLFRACFENDQLWSEILWEGTTPIAGTMSFIDSRKKYIVPSLMVFNEKYCKYSPGTVMELRTIRYAIENGFRTYDLGVHEKWHNFHLGGRNVFNRNIVISNVGYIRKLRSRLKIRARLRRFVDLFYAGGRRRCSGGPIISRCPL